MDQLGGLVREQSYCFGKKTYKSFEEARSFVHSLGLKNYAEWRAWTTSLKFPRDIPAFPRAFYKDKGWKGYLDWLGTTRNTKRKKYRAFDEARKYVRSLGLKNSREWHMWAKSGSRPDDIPTNPWKVYTGNRWIGLGDWLGTGNSGTRYRIFLPFEEARTFVRSIGLKGFNDWVAWRKSPERPKDIPAAPHMKYKDNGWAGWGDWLGTGWI